MPNFLLWHHVRLPYAVGLVVSGAGVHLDFPVECGSVAAFATLLFEAVTFSCFETCIGPHLSFRFPTGNMMVPDVQQLSRSAGLTLSGSSLRLPVLCTR